MVETTKPVVVFFGPPFLSTGFLPNGGEAHQQHLKKEKFERSRTPEGTRYSRGGHCTVVVSVGKFMHFGKPKVHTLFLHSKFVVYGAWRAG